MRSHRVPLLWEEGSMLGLTMTMLRPDRGVFSNGMTYALLG